ncbi:MAG TPA: 23S rRNA (cytosine(1962)-C(5))-methyltransferase RlmI, partial [Myxococcota bacterium]
MQVVLSPGKDKAARRRHPWIFSGAIAKAPAGAGVGDTVDVVDKLGALLGRGAYSPSSQIRVRLWTFDDTAVDDAFFRTRVDEAVALRQRMVLSQDTNCARLIFAEGDGLPGLVADLYDDTVVVQCQSAGAERVRDVVVARLLERTGAKRAYERSDADV